MKRVAALAACFLVSSVAAGAAGDPLALYRAGDYDAAIAQGVADNDGAGLSVAARAALAQAQMWPAPCLSCLQKAEGYARRAVALNSRLPEAHVYLAAALGYEARIIGPLAARLRGYAMEAKRNIDAALANDPRNARALAARGGWNIAIVHNGGALLARLLYGASLKQGLADFDAALRLEPDSLLLHYQYALSLAGYDVDRFRPAIERALADAVSEHPTSAYDAFARGRANALLAALRGSDDKRAARLIRQDQGIP